MAARSEPDCDGLFPARKNAQMGVAVLAERMVQGFEASVDPVVQEAVRVAGWRGVVLPEMRVLSVPCYPVVEPRAAAWERVHDDEAEVLDEYTLNMWESWPGGFPSAPDVPLNIVGFVSTRPWRTALKRVSTLAGLGAGMVVVEKTPSTLNLSEADARGAWVCSTSAATPLVLGRRGPVATAHRCSGTRRVEELLFGAIYRAVRAAV